MKKKIIAFLLASTMAISTTACGGISSKTPTDTETTESVTATLEPIESPSVTPEETESDENTTEDETSNIPEEGSLDSSENISDDEYYNLLVKYGDIFTEKLSILSNNNIASLIEQNSDLEVLQSEIDNTLSALAQAEKDLQSYYDDFDKDRTKPPMGTKIMTLLSYAQSALRQYTIGVEHLNDYINYSHDQSDIDHMVKYIDKATTSLNDFKQLLDEEQQKLSIQ